MSDNKTLELKTVKTQLTSQINEQSNDLKSKKINTKKIIKILLQVFFILILLFGLFRVPFVGSYIDAGIDYIFGATKYIFYLVMITALIFFLFKIKYRKLFLTKRFILCSLAITFIVGCCISVVWMTYLNFTSSTVATNPLAVITDYNTNWLSYAQSVSYDNFFNGAYISGGIIPVLIMACFVWSAWVLFAIILFLILIIIVLIIFNVNWKDNKLNLKIKKFIITKLGGSFDYEGLNELKPSKTDIKVKKFDKEKMIKEMDDNANYPSIKLLPNTAQDYTNQNTKYFEKKQDKISKFFKSKNFKFSKPKLVVHPNFTEIVFEVEDDITIQQILQLQQEIANTIEVEEYNISYKGTFVTFELENPEISKISFKEVLSMSPEIKSTQAIIGIDEENNPFTHDLKTNHSTLIIGKKGSGAASVVVLIALSLAYLNSPEKLEILFLSPSGSKSYGWFNSLPHIEGKVYETTEKIINKLHDLKNELQERLNNFNLSNVKDIDSYNKVAQNDNLKYKNKLILFPNFDLITKDSFQNNEIIESLLKDGPKAGMNLILQANGVNNESINPHVYNSVDSKYILKVENDYESLKLLDNYRAIQLYGNGDCLYFDRKNNKKRIQACYINQIELNQNIEIIKTFYDLKDQEENTIKDEKLAN